MRCRDLIRPAMSLASAAAVAAQQVPPPHVDAFVQDHCVSCHGEDKVKGGLDLTIAPTSDVQRLWRWSRMRDRVHAVEMPPAHVSEVTAEERARFARWVEELLAKEVPELERDPGAVTVRRLSRGQWQNAVRDLFGVEADVSGFPADDLGYGFDSIGDALTVSTLHLEKYLAAAQGVAAQVFHGEDPANPERRLIQAESMALVDDRGARLSGDYVNMYTNATIEQSVQLPRDGVYRVRIVAGALQAGDEPAKMLYRLDGDELDLFEVEQEVPKDFVSEGSFRKGEHRIALSFINDFYDPENPDPERRDRNLHIDAIEILGPLDARPVPQQQAWLHDAAKGRTDIARLRTQIVELLTRVWRRAPTSAERKRVQRRAVDMVRDGDTMLSAQRFALTVALTSPNFLFRVEPQVVGDGAQPITGAQLATRLSFFLWASTPDRELAKLGRSQRLLEPAVLEAQVERMLGDPRASRLASDFAGQWLELRSLAERTPDVDLFPSFNSALRRSFVRETEMLFEAVLREQRDVRELLDCNFTHVDAQLARFYGLPHDGPPGEFARVLLEGEHRRRGGLLGHGSMHVVTSNPTRTSPVKRGKWILDNLLGQAPPPPEPGSDSFADEEKIDSSKSLREQMAQHRERSKCAVCHVRMDAFGLALERFDAVGRYRATDAAGEIDASGRLPNGTLLDGVADLKRALVADPAFVRTVAHKLFVYAVGRDLLPADRLRIDLAVRQLLQRGKVTLKQLILLVVRDVAFTMTTAR